MVVDAWDGYMLIGNNFADIHRVIHHHALPRCLLRSGLSNKKIVASMATVGLKRR